MTKYEGNTKCLPPKYALRLFQWYCRPKLRDHIEGDLIEEYNKRINAYGKRKANVKFIIDVLMLMRPGIVRPMGYEKNSNTYSMYKSYFTIGWRNLIKNKGYSFINIGGLATGMAIAMLIGLWIYDEVEFNKYHKNYNSIAQVYKNGTLNGETFTYSYLPYALADELKTKYTTTFKNVVVAWPAGDNILSAGDTKVTMRGQYMESPGVEMFSLNMLQGSMSALNDPHSIILSQSAAVILFGEDNPMDKLLKINNQMDVKVAGIYEDLPNNTDLYGIKFFGAFELILSANEWAKHQGFGNNFLHIYASILGNTSFEKASEQIKNGILNNVQDDKSYVAINPQLFLHPMEKWHLYSEFKNGINTGGHIRIVWLFGVIGSFVLLVACINFMNLSTARSEKRAKEVGIRKAIGSKRGQLMHQFFSESFLVVTLAFVFSLAMVSLSLTWFNDLASKQIVMPWSNMYFWLSCFAFVLFTGLLAGSYPSLYLSSFNPVSVLKGSLRVGRYASIPRKILVVVQFTVSITLIIGTIIVYQQIQFAKNRDVGYTRNGLLMIPMTSGEFHKNYDVLRTELLNTGVVNEVARSSSPPTNVWNTNGGFDWNGKDPALQPEFATFTVTTEYGKALGWQFVNGRDFSKDLASDSSGFVINEAAAKILGFKNPIGEVVRWQSWWTNGIRSFTIVGVIKDMVMTSPYASPQPGVYFLGPVINTYWINVRINPQTQVSTALTKIESVFNKIIPSAPFDYKFADQEYALKFAAEERVGKLAAVFAVLAIFISCLGLFGLASFVAEQRTKEIGIRKIVGASVFTLWKMLSKDFVMLVIISCAIAIPIAYYYLGEWLTNYEYRTEMSWWIFISASIGALLVTLLTVSYQAVKAAMMKPVESLRSE